MKQWRNERAVAEIVEMLKRGHSLTIGWREVADSAPRTIQCRRFVAGYFGRCWSAASFGMSV
ncbi:hypothetical protein Acor_83000 [Acrocarpospora corrugata]|uniref:Uncharacterized protein n=1 Tax=Acrocarpospora corrugata TaxID=35763 RepID=A0A5M3WGK0_9ACTN|nr:hypothetical protein Acor_83000 [Acrocarpospora corrugata]